MSALTRLPMRSARLLIVAPALAALTVPRWLQAQSRPPAAERQDVTDVYFGTTITDPNRWLENWREGKAADCSRRRTHIPAPPWPPFPDATSFSRV